MIARKTLLIMAANVVSGLMGVIALKLIALYFGDFVWGQVFFATSILGVAFILQDLGFHDAHVKFVSAGRDIGKCLTTFAVLKLILTLAFVLVAAGGLYVYHGLLGKDLVSTTIPTVIIMLLVNVVLSLRAISRTTLDAQQATAKGQTLIITETAARVAFTVLFAAGLASTRGEVPFLAGSPFEAWVNTNPSEALALTWLVGAFASLLYGFYALRGLPWGTFDKDLAKEYARFAFPFMVLSGISLLAANIDGTTVGYFWSAAEAGQLGGAQRLTLLLGLIATAAGTLLFPHISGLNATEEGRAKVREVFERSLRLIGLVIVPMTVFVVAYPEAIIRLLLAESFTGGSDILIALTLNTFVYSLTGPYYALVSGLNRPATAARIGAITAVLIVALDFLLVPSSILGVPLFGLKAFGAALGTLLASCVTFILLRIAAYRLVGAGGGFSHLLRQIVAGAAMFGALLAFASLIPDFGRWYHLGAAGVVGSLAYLLALVVLREFTKEDFRYFADLLNPGPTLRYLKAELFGR